MLPASTGDRKPRDISQGQAGRPRGRDPAADRPLAAGRRRLRGARRAQRLRRLRRAPGRRRHALRGDHRRVRGAAPGASAAGRREGARADAADGSVAAVASAWSTAGRSATSTTREDSAAEVDANVVMTGDGGLVEVQATAERTPFSRASLDELLGARRGRHRHACAEVHGAARLSRRMPRLILATRNRHKLRELRELLPGLELEPLPDGVELPPEDGDTFAENALSRRARRRGDRRGRDRRRLRDRGRGPRRGARGRSARYAGEGATDEENLDKLLRRGRRGDGRPAGRLRLRDGPGRRGRRRARLRRPLRGAPARASRAATRRLRLRPGLRPGRHRPDDERTMAELSPPRRTRSATAAAPRAMLAAHLGLRPAARRSAR